MVVDTRFAVKGGVRFFIPDDPKSRIAFTLSVFFV